jgi:tetratricopeptide (TPR) repeat protein
MLNATKPIIFISYSRKDKRWLEYVQGHLQVGVTNDHFDTWDDRRIEGGADWANEIDEALRKCSAFILLVSRHSLVSTFILKQEVQTALDAHWQRGVKIYPIIVAACDVQAVPWLTKMNIRPRDAKPLSLYSSAKRDEVMAALAREIRDIVKNASTIAAQREDSSPAAKPLALSNITIHVPRHFMGREDALSAIDTTLKRTDGRVAITALHGLRGVGKTTLAAAYAERHRGDYRATWWLRAQATSTLRADLVALGVQLGWVGLDDKEETAVDIVMKRLRDEGEGILLIFDNAADANALDDYLPQRGGGKVLVTSNAPTWRGIAEPTEVHVWSKEVGADYLTARTGRATERLVAEALSQLLDDTRDAPTAYHSRLTVAKTFGLAIEEAAKLHPAAEPLITHAALLAPEPIPLLLFSEAREKFGEPLATALADDGATCETEKAELAANVRCADLLNRTGLYFQARAAYSQARPLFDRALVIRKTVLGPERPDTAQSLNNLAFLLHNQGDLAAARPLYKRALTIREKVLGPEHRDTAVSLNNLARLLQDQGDLAAAQPLFERGLAIREKVLGPEHPNTAGSLNNLALLLQDQGDRAAARPLLERALAIREKVLGPEHPDTIKSRENLARLIKDQTTSESREP